MVPKTSVLLFPFCRSSSQLPGVTFFRAGHGWKPQICRWNCHPICHSSRVFPVLVAALPFPVVGHCRSHPGSVSSHWAWLKPQNCHWNCSDICHTVGDKSTSGFDGHTAISGYPSMSHLFVDTFFHFDVVKNFVYHARTTVILISYLFGCMSLWLWLCSRWRPITTSGFDPSTFTMSLPPRLYDLLALHLWSPSFILQFSRVSRSLTILFDVQHLHCGINFPILCTPYQYQSDPMHSSSLSSSPDPRSAVNLSRGVFHTRLKTHLFSFPP